jgi:3-deoxy-D-manno-octulosonate 8-phosphate phosphatase (KDO 8-P phosphatase)
MTTSSDARNPVSPAELALIRFVALDVDGVLTDGTFFWGPDGQEWKRFCFADVMGISLAAKRGVRFALVSGEESLLVDRFARKMGIDDVVKGCKDKAAAVAQLMARHDLPREAVCFMGDDVNDLTAMSMVGLSVAPANANEAVLAVARVVTKRRGGDGAVRELLDRLSTSSANP